MHHPLEQENICLRAALAEAREALKPLAGYAQHFRNMPDDYEGHFILTAGQCRQAERVLSVEERRHVTPELAAKIKAVMERSRQIEGGDG